MPILGVAGNVVSRAPKKKAGQPRRSGARRKHGVKKTKETPEQRALRRAAMKARRRERLNSSMTVPLNAVGHGRYRQFQLYALRLQGGKYYVGMTAYWDARRRFGEHLSGKGAKWTALYRPIDIIETRQLGEVYESVAAAAETDMTIEYMPEYGTAIVRGGDMCHISHEMIDKKFRAHLRRKLTTREVQTDEREAA